MKQLLHMCFMYSVQLTVLLNLKYYIVKELNIAYMHVNIQQAVLF